MKKTAALLVFAACGGAQKPPPGPEAEPKPVLAEPGADTEAYANVSAYFNRKRPQVSQCYADALSAGKVDPKARGYVTVALTVPTSGKPENVHVAADTLKSEMVGECVVRLVNSWLLPKPSASIEFSFSYNFLPL